MSDHEDAASEAAPEGWSRMFNQMNFGSPLSTSIISKSDEKVDKSKSIDLPETTGWFSGWFGTDDSAKAKKTSSISSDTPPVVTSRENSSDGLDDRAMLKSAEDLSEADESDLDSDGFPVENRSDAGKAVSESSESSESSDSSVHKSLDGATEQVVAAPSSRRARLLNRQLFVLAHTAAELVAPDEVEVPKAVEKTWWEFVDGTETAPTVPVAVDTTRLALSPPLDAHKVAEPSDVAVVAPPLEVPVAVDGQEKGIWQRVFGPANPAPPSPAAQARALLPEISLPPTGNSVNSFFSPPSEVEGINILGPSRIFGRFEGRLRGWPRHLAPQWSSETNSPKRSQISFSQPPSGAAALAMFRVT